MKFEAVSGFEWSAKRALSSAKSPVIVLVVVGWSDVTRLSLKNEKGSLLVLTYIKRKI
jgi:hypothetical protein